MKIIIVGAGEIGTELAKMLTNDKHDVIVLEKDASKIAKLTNTLDIMVLEENGARITALEHAGVKDADVLIAATDIDEINIMSCMIAKKIANIKTVARVRNSEYSNRGLLFSNQQLGVDIIIDPEQLTAMEIAKLIKTPVASDIEYFANGKIEMFVFKVDKDSEIVGKSISSLPISQNFLIIAISVKTARLLFREVMTVFYPMTIFM
jgi:trk system potassium uptake protein TrkA